MLKRTKKNEKGFTLVELVVVIAILAVLVTLIVPRITGNVGEAKKSTHIGNARTLASEITVYNAKQDTAATRIKAAPLSGIVASTDLTGKIDLPSGFVWPLTLYADVIIDAAGNASVNIK